MLRTDVGFKKILKGTYQKLRAVGFVHRKRRKTHSTPTDRSDKYPRLFVVFSLASLKWSFPRRSKRRFEQRRTTPSNQVVQNKEQSSPLYLSPNAWILSGLFLNASQKNIFSARAKGNSLIFGVFRRNEEQVFLHLFRHCHPPNPHS